MTKNKQSIVVVIALIILTQVIYMTYMFVYEKKDYHSDEIWSYGLANSQNGPYIYMTDDQSENRNFNEWLSGDVLREYVTVQPGDEFDYENVWYNLGRDMHPPLYFSVLHTICSIFSGQHSLMYAFVINIIAFVIGQIFLAKTVKNISDSDIMSVGACILWGFSVGATSVTVFLRHYGLSTMWIIILLYLYSNMMKRKEYGFVKDILPIAIVTLLGGMTNHFFTVFAFFFTGCFCFYFLFTKRFKLLFKYAVSIIMSVVILLTCLPTAVSTASTRVEASSSIPMGNYDYQFVSCCAFTMRELFGINKPVYGSLFLLYSVVGIGVILFLLIPVVMVFRNEKWLHELIKKTVEFMKKLVLIIAERMKNFPYILFAMAVTSLCVIAVVSYMIQVPLMHAFTDRYLSVIFPTVSILFLLTAYKIILLFISKKDITKVAAVLLVVCVCDVIWCNMAYDSPYIFAGNVTDEYYMTNQEVSDLVSGADCMVGYTTEWYLTMAPTYLYDAANVFAFDAGMLNAEDILEEPSLLELQEDVLLKMEDVPKGEREMFLITNAGNDNLSVLASGDAFVIENQMQLDTGTTLKEVTDYIDRLPGVVSEEYLGYTYVFGTKYYIYKIV